MMNKSKAALHIHITGIVQGVGFRPFVYSQAEINNLTGWVRNTSSGVDIRVEGDENGLNEFVNALRSRHPKLALIDTLEINEESAQGLVGFEIIQSRPVAGAFQPISPDISICPDCLRELFDPGNRRYRYPFINCTNCGPRFTIIEDIPYDRPNTTMASFELCPECAAEYTDPTNRRFHAQPIACKVCGPKVWLENSSDQQIIAEEEQAISETLARLSSGQVIAIKGLGGFHLACDATNLNAVALLRSRKMRVDKPFAVMISDMQHIEQNCYVSEEEHELLTSRERPIVILQRRLGSKIAAEVAPRQNTIGVMLPYTPLHYLLFAEDSQNKSASLQALVMTSGNLSEEPIAITNEEARQRLSQLADAFLMHNRLIRTRCDDSVVRAHPETDKHIYPIRRSRGYAPFPINLGQNYPAIMAFGAELKNTFCVTHDQYAFMSHHIGDLQNYETLVSFLDGIDHYKRLFRIKPELLAYDLHPDYLSTRTALSISESEKIHAVGIQHHHAHIVSCMAEHGLPPDEPVIGIALDGTGYGLDEAIWGGEFLLATYSQFERKYHLGYMPLPGGDAAIHQPARIALAYLWQAGLDWNPALACVSNFCAEDRTFIRSQLEHQLNTPLTSSAGRLFDAVSALAGVNLQANYEAQAAIELEALVDPNEQSSYPVFFDPASTSIALDWLIESVVKDAMAGVAPFLVASRFHFTFVNLLVDVIMTMRNLYKINSVVLSGGVWQNVTLLQKFLQQIHGRGLKVYTHSLLPPNDGGLALGQAVIAAHSTEIRS
jgi:hydrogenase maturation protein HypF